MAVLFANMILGGSISIDDPRIKNRAEVELVLDYYNKVNNGEMELEDVPEKYRNGIKNLIIIHGNK